MKSLSIEFGSKSAGLATIWFNKSKWNFALHVLPKKDHRVWGKVDYWWDGPIVAYGLGPLFSFIKEVK